MQKHPGKLVFIAALWCVFLFCRLQPATAQQSPVPANSAVPVEHDGVYEVGNGVIAPKTYQVSPPEYPVAAQKAHIEGVCVLSVTVDQKGKPHEVKVIQNLTKILDKSAVDAVKRYRYTPATLEGKPVPARINVSVEFALPKPQFRILPLGYGVGPVRSIAVTSDVAKAALIRSAPVDYPKAARRARMEGTCVIRLTINQRGVPEDMVVEKSAGPLLDASALNSVKQYRYRPLIFDGQPFAMHTRVTINFRLH